MPIRIVIADDHAMFRSGIKAVLETDEDLEVVAEAGDGLETLTLVDQIDFDVLVLDLGMPGLSGPQIAERALGKRPGLPIVILTMHDDEHYVQELLRIGVGGYILKKSTGSDLRQAVRAVYRGERYMDPTLMDLIVSLYVEERCIKLIRLELLVGQEAIHPFNKVLCDGWAFHRAPQCQHASAVYSRRTGDDAGHRFSPRTANSLRPLVRPPHKFCASQTSESPPLAMLLVEYCHYVDYCHYNRRGERVRPLSTAIPKMKIVEITANVPLT